jgi:DNA-binding NtrC family response regulator
VNTPWDTDALREARAQAAAAASRVAPAPAAKLQAPQVAGSILVIDTDPSLARGLQRVLGEKATVREAGSPAEAANVLQSHDVAAVVADLRAGGASLLSLFKLLKAKRPHTLSILLSGEPDSESVTELVNQAQVHRFLAKPVNARELQEHVNEALKRYASGFAEGVAPLPDRLVSDAA